MRPKKLADYVAEDDDGCQMGYERLAAESREWFGFKARRAFTLSIPGDPGREEVRDLRKARQRGPGPHFGLRRRLSAV